MPGNVRGVGGGGSQKPPHATPTRAMSLDSLQIKNVSCQNVDQKIQEYIPTRTTKATPKINHAAMQFVKTGPATLYKSAQEQIKKAEEVKELRKTMVNEETEWQEPSSSSNQNTLDEGSDWQSNLDKWKSSRRKRLQNTVESIIQIKKNEQEDEMNRMRRKSKTFSQMQEDKNKRGRKYNLTIHDDDDNDLSSLGLTPSKSNGSITDTQEDQDAKDLDQDNKDAKSDAGFCTGSDTGSDGVFAEDNISDTSSALGDKKEAHDSLLDTGGSKDEEPHLNGHSSSLISEVFSSTSTTTTSSISHTAEYTYDKAIAGYKQYAENSAKKRTSSITSLNSNASHKEEDKKEKPRLNGRSPSPNKSSKMEEKVNFFSKEMEKENRISPDPRVVMREKSPQVNISQRRSMFENVDLSTVQIDQQKVNRRSLDISNSLRNKVASFENLESDPPTKARGTSFTRDTNLRSKVSSFENLSTETNKIRGITPPRDANFHVKLAAFSSSDSDNAPVKKRTPERDMNFHKKLASFNAVEMEETPRDQKTIPQGDPSLKKKIASYEQLEQAAESYSGSSREETMKSKDRSMSLENLDEPQMEVKMRPSRSMVNINRRVPSTPYMEVEIENSRSEKECVVEAQPAVNAQVFEIASKLEETPILGSPIGKVPSIPLTPPPAQEDDSLEAGKQYTDADINEVINDYEQVGDALEDSSAQPENIYENIIDEPMYENIYEKVDENKAESQEAVEEHQYQTLEEVRQEVVPPPTAPVKMPPMEPPEVLDVTWTDGPSQAAPPSEPPPPPPPDDDSDSDASEQPQSLPEEDCFKRENSTRRLKKELWRRRSNFLGTTSQYIEEEQAVKPPPDLSDLLRQEREAERSLIGSKPAKTTTQEMLTELEIARQEREIIENLERSEQLKQQQQQQQQIWKVQEEDAGAGEVDDHLQYQECLRSNSTSSPSGCQDFVPLPTPSSLPDSSQTFANTMPTPSDFIPVSPQPKGDETSVTLSSSSSLTNTVHKARPTLSFTPVPPCWRPMTSPKVLTPSPSNKQTVTPVWSPACATNVQKSPSPSIQFSSFDKAVTHPSDSDSSHRVVTSSENSQCNITANETPTSEGSASQFSFNNLPKPWANKGTEELKGNEECTSNKVFLKAARDKKTVRFKIASFEDRQNSCEDQTPILSNFRSDGAAKKSLIKKDGVTIKNPGNLESVDERSKLHEPHSYFTSFSLSSSQVKKPLTALELDTGPKVANVDPVTSTNNTETSHSVTETTNVEHVQTPDGDDWTHATCLESTINIEKRHAEVLDNHVANVPPEPQFRIATQTEVVAEGELGDHFVASSFPLDCNINSVASSGSHPDEYKKLAELEEEMMRHDKDMLRRVGHLPERPSSAAPSSDSYDIQEGMVILPPADSSFKMQRRQPPTHLAIQEFYTAPSYDTTPTMEEDSLTPSREDKSVGLPAGSPSDYATLASPHPFSRSNSHSSIDTKRHLPLQPNRSTPLTSPRESIPEPLPRKKKVATPQISSKTQRILPDLNTAERLEAMRVSRMTSNESLMSGGEQMEPQGSSSALSGQQMSKQTLLALSAIPKPRLTDNESWIKKKQEGQKRDYSKHWLHQEAEQRRLEQQDRISRPKYTPPLPQRRSPQSASPQFPSHQQSSPQTTSYLPTQTPSAMYPTQNISPTYSSYPQTLRSPSPNRNASPSVTNNNNNNNNINNNSTTSNTTSSTNTNATGCWRNQATTYQPHIPAPAANGDKALPDSIINNLTQRINNKNTKNTYNSCSGRAGSNYSNSNYRDENYHDYMNADALSSASGPSPHFQAGQPSPPAPQPEANSPQDQRLLSVSGKKKCSHCSEELGRGAAMIIESLRLFYHIPCFKCCVCGIQLGNGSAGADVRVRNHKLHCHNCYSNDEGMKFSKV
ncbi:uncharacterized protein LOC135102093 isoform X4 [Scylla paramamosain]|uniref:uncharacterized protein LOC135102093 isoform X4 n=1 Tax=Scylla paramamosain TaxID=85552 RepID=UPI0030834653